MYTKIIQSGNLLEIYEYEKEPIPPKAKRRKPRRSYGRRVSRNSERARRSFFRLVRSNVGFGASPALLTLTMYDIVPIGDAWKCFTAFFARWNRKRKAERLRFIAVSEFQKRGAVHFHVLVWGLTDEEISSERDTRAIQAIWTYGFIDCIKTDGNPKLAGYLAKYMSKAMQDQRLFGRKAFSASRGLVRPVSLNTKTQIAYAQELWGLKGESVDNLVLTEETYATLWLGRCKYKQIRLSNPNAENHTGS